MFTETKTETERTETEESVTKASKDFRKHGGGEVTSTEKVIIFKKPGDKFLTKGL